MSFDYVKTQSVADKLINQFGRRAELQRDAGSRDCMIVETEYSAMERDGQLIMYTDRRILCAAGGLDPAPDPEEDRLIIDDVPLRVVTVKPLQPADVPIMYELQVRR